MVNASPGRVDLPNLITSVAETLAIATDDKKKAATGYS